MAGLGDLVISLHAEIARFTSDMGRAARVSEQQSKRIADSVGRATKLVAGYFTIEAIQRFHQATIGLADDVGKMAQKVGMSAESLSALQYSAKLSDVSTETLAQSLKKLSVGMLEMQSGTGDAEKAFKALNISVEVSKGNLKTSEQVLFEVAEKFAAMEDGAGKTALAVKLFGRAGTEMIPLLNSGAKGLRENAEEAKKFGIIISTEAAKKAEEFNDNLTRLTSSLGAFGMAIANDALPSLSNFVKELVLANKQAGGFWSGLLNYATTPGGDPIQRLNEINKKLEVLKQQKADLSKDTLANRINQRLPVLLGGNDLVDLDRQIKRFEKLRETYTALAESRGELDNFDASLNRPVKTKAPAVADEKSIKELEEIKKLYDEVARLGASMDVSVPFIKNKEALQEIKKTLEEGKKDWLAYADSVFAAADAENQAAAGGESFTQMAEKAREKVLDLIDPLRAVRKEHEQLDVLVATGWLTEMEGRLAKLPADIRALIQPIDNIHERIQKLWEAGVLKDEEMEKALEAIADKTDDAKKATDEYAHAIGTAFEDAIVGGKKFRDVLAGIAQDIARIILRQTVTKPLERAIGGLDFGNILGGIFGGGSSSIGYGTIDPTTSGIVGSFASGTDFVPRTGLALVHKGERITPAGESGSGVSIVNQYNIDSRTDQGAIAAMIKASEQRTLAQVADSTRRGGGYSKAVRG